MAETFLTHPGVVLAGFVTEAVAPVKTITTLKQIQQAYAKASAAEKQQIVQFTRANRTRVTASWWFLAVATHLDTGRKFLTVGFSMQPPGVTGDQLCKVVGIKT